MNALRKYLGLVWMILGPAAIIFLILEAAKKISEKPTQDVYLPWIIIITVFAPIAAGMVIFGWYAWNKEYNIDDKV